MYFIHINFFIKMIKTLFIIILLTILFSESALPFSIDEPVRTTLSGKITDKKTGEALPDASVYIPDLKTGTMSGKDGSYRLEDLPQSKVLVQVSLIGYKLISDKIDLSKVSEMDFAMEESIVELNEIVVTGLSEASERNRTPTPITTISPVQLKQSSATNIIDAIATYPGISQITTGSGISKPVIRGLGYNRVVVVNDGVRQEGQQWGDEHGIEIDEYTVNKVEILKGPASLAYGSDAMAGVINLISAPTLPNGVISGNLLSNYQTNNGLIGLSASLSGNQKGFIWDLRYSNKSAHSYKNKYDGYVFNSCFKENNLSGIIGLNKSWGYSHLHFSVYNLTPGIIEGERDRSTGKFVKVIAVNDTTEGSEIANNSDLKSYTPVTPYQKIHHYSLVLNNNFILGNGSLKTIIGWQQNQRQEFADILKVNQYGLYFLLNSVNYEVHYNLPEKNNYNISFGASGMYQNSLNKGTEFLIPDYNLFDIGVFGIVKKSYVKLNLSGGLRYDIRNEHGKDLYVDADGNRTVAADPNSIRQFSDFHSEFYGVSGSVGAAYQFNENFYTKLNISKGFRAPNIAELSANGVHEGTVNYIIGVPTLKPENSLQLDYAFGVNTLHVTGEASLFYNKINNYIFLEKLQGIAGGDSITDGFSTFKYSSGNADLYGGELSIDIHPHPLDWLHFENTFSYVQSLQEDQPDSSKYLPFTPPFKITSELRADIKKLSENFHNSYFLIGVDKYFAQNKFYSANGTETATPGYALLNIGIGTDVVINKKTLFSLYLNVNNLTDAGYQSHLSRLKYEAVNEVTGRTGVFNMGRNISMKLIVPFDIRRQGK